MITPKKAVQAIGFRERMFGRALSLPDGMQPASDSEADLAGDAFFGLYSNPALLDEPPADRAINHSLMEYARTMSAWSDARSFCDGNAAATLATTSVLWEKLRTDEAIQQALKQQEEASQARDDAESKQAAADALKDIDPTQAQQMAEQAQKAQQHADALAQALSQRAGEITGNRLNQAVIASALKAGQEAGKEVATVMGGWGMDAGAQDRMSGDGITSFMRRIKSDKLAKIARLAGRFRGIGFDARNQRVVEGFLPDDVITTQDPALMFPSELAKISPGAPDAIRKMAATQWAEGGLLGWELKGDAEEAGPFVGAVDVSGSMMGMREINAKAITLGIAQIAKSENRRYELFSFSSNDNTIHASSDDDWLAHMNWAEQTIRGGTSFDIALTKAMALLDQIEQDGGKAGAADILFVSDGEAIVSPETAEKWTAYKERTGSRLFYVAVGRGYGSIEQLADRVFSVDELAAESADNLTRQIATGIQ